MGSMGYFEVPWIAPCCISHLAIGRSTPPASVSGELRHSGDSRECEHEGLKRSSCGAVRPLLGAGKKRRLRGRSCFELGLALILLAATAGCSHLNPYENAGRLPADDPRRLLPALPRVATAEPAPAFIGTVPGALAEVDGLRGGLMLTSASMASERAVYDAALWTLTPVMLYGVASRGTGSKSAMDALLGGSLLLGAGYAFLNSRPKEYEEIYLSGADRMTCLMVQYTRDLFTQEDFGSWWKGDASPWESFSKAILEYRVAVSEAVRAVSEAPTKRAEEATCASEGNDCKVRRSAIGSSSSPNARAVGATMQAHADRITRRAQQQLSQLQGLTRRIRYEAGLELRSESRAIMTEIKAELNAKRPDMVTVAAAMTALKRSVDDATAAIAKAQSRRDHGTPDPSSTELRTLSLPRHLDKGIVKKIRDAEAALTREQAQAESVSMVRDEKSRQARALYSRMGCPARQAQQVAGSVRPGGGSAASEGLQGQAGQGMVPSETPLAP